MRKHIIFIIITAVLCCYTASSQEIKYNNFNNQYVIIRTQKGNISLRPFSNTIMEVTWHDDGIIVNDSSVAVTAKPVKNDFVFTMKTVIYVIKVPKWKYVYQKIYKN